MKLYKKILPLVGTIAVVTPTVLTSCDTIKSKIEYSKSRDGEIFPYDESFELPRPEGKVTDTFALTTLFNDSITNWNILPNDIANYKVNILNPVGTYFQYDDLKVELYNIEKVEERESSKTIYKYYLSFNIYGSGIYKNNYGTHNFNSYLRIKHLRYGIMYDDSLSTQDRNLWFVMPYAYQRYVEIEPETEKGIFKLLNEQDDWYITTTINIEDTISLAGSLNYKSTELIEDTEDANEIASWTLIIMEMISFWSRYLIYCEEQ